MTHILLEAEKQYNHDLLNKYKHTIRKSWSIIKDIIRKIKKSLCQSKFQLADDKKLISEKFNDFFSQNWSNFSKENSNYW